MMNFQMGDENNRQDHVEDDHTENECVDEEDHEEDYEDEYYNSSDKWRYSIYSALVFLIISSPYTYTLVNKLVGKFVKISSPSGCPTSTGVFVHAIVFALIIRGMMELDI